MRLSHRPSHAAAPAKTSKTFPAVIVLQEEPGLGAPLGSLAALLAQTISASFGDSIVVLHAVGWGAHAEHEAHPHAHAPAPSIRVSDDASAHFVAGPPSGRYGAIETDRHGSHDFWVHVPEDVFDAREAIRANVRSLGESYAYVVLDLSRLARKVARAVVEYLGSADIGFMARRLVHLTKSRANPVVAAQWSVLRTDILGPLPPDTRPDGPLPDAGLRDLAAQGAGFVRDLTARLGGKAIEPQGEAYPEGRVNPEWCRARLDLAAIAKRRAADLEHVAGPERETLARWARAVTFRRVGIALGGGGSWGYAHVALMQELCDAGVPIDLVGGSSSGSMMGAYYAVLGRRGLDLAIERRKRLAWMGHLSTITSTMIDLTLTADLGHVLLEDVEVIFLPVATNLTRARAEVITHSTVGSGVRASGSAPGLFAATLTRTGLYVDGAITDNVPVVLVERMGADLLIACNPLPPPPRVEVRTPGSPLSDFLAELNPVHRVRDLMVSFALMMHEFGDCEDADTRIVYDPPPTYPKFSPSEFDRAPEILEAVRKEPIFRETVRKSIDAWHRLSARRSRGMIA